MLGPGLHFQSIIFVCSDVLVDDSYSEIAVEAVYKEVARTTQSENVGRRPTVKIVNVRKAGEDVLATTLMIQIYACEK